MFKEILFLLLLINMTMSAPAQLEDQIEGMIEKLLSIQNQVQNKLDEIQNLKESDQYARHKKESDRYGRQRMF